MKAKDLPIWMINLERAPARAAAMEAQFARLGLKVKRMAAVDGAALSCDERAACLDERAFRRHMGRAPLDGEIGCHLSHLRVWQELAMSGAEIGLVLEDDVVFHDDFLPALEAALGARAAWDMLKLNCIRAKVPLCQAHLVSAKRPYRLNAYLGPATGFGAYAITRALAAQLTAQMPLMRMPIDYEATRFFEYDFRLLGLEPFPSHVDDGGESTITGTRFDKLQKPPRYKRLGNYAMRAANYKRRLLWLARKGMLRFGALRKGARA